MNFIFSVLFTIGLLPVESSKSNEIDSKHQAMYLSNLIRYVDWKEDETTVGVIGDSLVSSELKKLTKNNSKIEILYMENLDRISECNMVYLPNATNTTFYQTQTKIDDTPLLLVVNVKKFVQRGAEVGFYLEDGGLKFAINTLAVEQTGMRISSKLLSRVNQF